MKSVCISLWNEIGILLLNSRFENCHDDKRMKAKMKKTLAQAIEERRATPSFDGEAISPEDLKQILEAGLQAPSGYNVQPWRFIVVQSPEQKKRLRAASYNQAKVEEASAVIVACGDADGWRKDVDLMLKQGRDGGMPESYAAQAKLD